MLPIWIGRLLDGGEEKDGPNDKHDAHDDETDELDVHEIRPDPDFVLFLLFERFLSLGQALVVLDALIHGVPREKPNQEQHGGNRHVVRLRHDEPKVGVEEADKKEYDRGDQDDQAGPFAPDLREIKGKGESDDGQREQNGRPGDVVDEVLD